MHEFAAGDLHSDKIVALVIYPKEALLLIRAKFK